ncbi:Uncharacterized protein OBRU01_04337 [Operophtera brumata]|uniref:Uncharacterized protein n=1 Tax=Operophtera brumata TaxID=104452 RepID=A0A0L7L9P3_OPEBR|nr:Uncharacterized protein OBRU01_04337 [Operophtera brumata]
MNHIKTGGGKPDYIPPDDALDRVASILGATCEGYSVAFGGDSEQIAMHDSMAEVSVDLEILSDGGGVIVSGVGEGDFESGGGVGNGGSLLGIGGSSGNDHGGVGNGGSLLGIGSSSGNDHGGVGNGGSLLGIGSSSGNDHDVRSLKDELVDVEFILNAEEILAEETLALKPPYHGIPRNQSLKFHHFSRLRLYLLALSVC